MNPEYPKIPERVGREIVYQSRWVNLYLDTVRFPKGHVIEKYHLLDFERQAVAAIMVCSSAGPGPVLSPLPGLGASSL